jgi:hypothetical protein
MESAILISCITSRKRFVDYLFRYGIIACMYRSNGGFQANHFRKRGSTSDARARCQLKNRLQKKQELPFLMAASKAVCTKFPDFLL